MLIGENKTSILSNDDLNDNKYLQVGQYKCLYNAIAKTLLHCPTKYAFTMTTVNATGGSLDASQSYLIQYVTPYINSCIFFRRVTRSVDDIWYSNWFEIATTDYVENLVHTPQRQKIIDGGLQKTIVVEGDASYYYPVHIECADVHNDFSNRLCISKKLYTATGLYSGNHSSGTSSCSFEYLWRSQGWDGSGVWCKTIHHSQPYASLVSNIQPATGSAAIGITVWLRGGGTEYKITSDVDITYQICYAETNLSKSSNYTYNVAPRTDIGNGGILDYDT